MAISVALTACAGGSDNVLMHKSFDTPHGVPAFDQISYADYQPAIEAALKETDEVVSLIVSNPAEPTFDNVIVPFDRRNEHLNVIAGIFGNLKETDNCDELTAIAQVVFPMLTANDDNVYMNPELFGKIKAVYDRRAELGDTSKVRVVEKYYNDFVRRGALLSEADQNTLREYNRELSLLSLTFGNNLLNETNDSYQLVIDNPDDLAGLPEGVIAAAADRAASAGHAGKWIFTLQKASMIPFLQYSERPELRKALYDGYINRGNNGNSYDNKNVLLKMATIRAKKAQLLGYKSHAHYVIESNMAKTPEAVTDFLLDLWKPALQKAKRELQDMRNFAYRYNRTTKVEAADWWYWAEKLRKAKYDVDEQTLSEYFVLENVQQGMFDVANKLYGVTFRRNDSVPHYNANDNVVYEVYEANGDYLGLIYFDWHPRGSKGFGAWCTSFQDAIDNFDGSRTPAQVSIVCNFTLPTADAPALLNFDEVQTMFHEFGHGLHGLFSKGLYRRTAGDVPRDYVELPSQIMEHWAAEPAVMKQYARHYKTGEVIPDELIAKLQNAGTFNQGFATVEYIAASLLDLKWHSISADTTITDVNAFEKAAMDEIGLIDEIVPRYRSTYFAHIFDGGYSAGYYVYMWAELLDCDAFGAYTESGDIFNADLAAKFRQHCLAEIGEADPMAQYKKFRGQEPVIDYLIEKRGLK